MKKLKVITESVNLGRDDNILVPMTCKFYEIQHGSKQFFYLRHAIWNPPLFWLFSIPATGS